MNGLLGDTSTVMPGLCIICIWRDSGYAMITYYACLRTIPGELIEASYVDGANMLQKFRYIIFPMLAPAFTINISLWLGWGLKVFDYPMIATHGGPGLASETVALYIYECTFPYYRAGYGQAAAVLMTISIFIITAVVTKALKKREADL
jgi:raffinose/stachyose/melibiose transport system permease protein